MLPELADPLMAPHLLRYEPGVQMAEAAMKDVQQSWNCRWARLASQFVGIPELEQPPDGLWVCVRPRRGRLTVNSTPPRVTEEECAGCEFWEPTNHPRA